MNALKKLIVLKDKITQSEPKLLNVEPDNSAESSLKLTYFQSGYGDSKNSLGNASLLKSCLENVYENFKEKCRKDEVEQKRLNAPYIEERERLKTELKKRETAKDIKKGHLEQCENKIKEIDSSIANVKIEPEKYGIDATSKPKAHFYIGLFVLIPITIYLITFYISASYSAFFKNFETSQLQAAIFDAQAFTNAWNHGWLEAIFVSTIPFAFMGLGYLIHMFLKDRRFGWIRVFALFLVTFIFDSILAYQIENKIYQFERTPMSPDFNLEIAIQRIEFWGIIFAGFVVYIIWGLVFDFIMKEHENYDKVKMFINNHKEIKDNLLKQKTAISLQIDEISSEITAINGKIGEIQSKIDGFIFPNRKYLLYHSEYVKGWLLAISKEIALPVAENQKLIENCQLISETHLKHHNVKNENNENVIYLNN